MTKMFKLSPLGEELIKFWEKLELIAYPDPGTGGDPWTIGWGHTGPDVVPGQIISREQAQILFAADTKWAVDAVSGYAHEAEQCEFDAMVSFTFNVGATAFKNSTLRKKFNAGDIDGAAKEFLRWNKAAGKTMYGLTRRRVAEQAMFLGQDWRKVLAEFDAVKQEDV